MKIFGKNIKLPALTREHAADKQKKQFDKAMKRFDKAISGVEGDLNSLKDEMCTLSENLDSFTADLHATSPDDAVRTKIAALNVARGREALEHAFTRQNHLWNYQDLLNRDKEALGSDFRANQYETLTKRSSLPVMRSRSAPASAMHLPPAELPERFSSPVDLTR